MSHLTLDIVNSDIVTEFIEFYYGILNSHDIEKIGELFKSKSQVIFDGKPCESLENIGELFSQLFRCEINLNIEKISSSNSGTRRFDILVNGVVTINEVQEETSEVVQITRQYSQYLHLAYGNDKTFWIQKIIFMII
tara:strand:- start:2950 stop:3360 length:411 start_codon:yes stop_codon:yes gene_type:complete